MIQNMTPELKDPRLPAKEDVVNATKLITATAEQLVEYAKEMVAQADGAAANVGLANEEFNRLVAQIKNLSAEREALARDLNDLNAKASEAEARVTKAERALEALRKQLG